jgi:hypothetical protein
VTKFTGVAGLALMLTLQWEYTPDASQYDGLVFRVYSTRDLTNWTLRATIPASEWQTNWRVSFPKTNSAEFFRVAASNALALTY